MAAALIGAAAVITAALITTRTPICPESICGPRNPTVDARPSSGHTNGEQIPKGGGGNPAFFTGTWTGQLTRLDSGTEFPVKITLGEKTVMSWGKGLHCTATLTETKSSAKEISLKLGNLSSSGGTKCFDGTVILTRVKTDKATIEVIDSDQSVRMSGQVSIKDGS
ncbi:hypothetical protein OG339_42050 [Streptosporangium sp. NBC_01495]|uniref:hypothetical protein n=1 Tax=Streptosporangium sp. NBC_01495 TaxID=2903899 RepID=UPI002E2FBB30|nr:hypothetical protein [Streptosporangium sp. NBC_01495]